MAFPKFTEGSTKRPTIEFDHGFLDDGHNHIDNSKRRPPTWEDYKLLAEWKIKLAGAEMLRPDLDDATRAYRHFLGTDRPARWPVPMGTDLPVNYERFLANDGSGKKVLQSAVEDTVASAIGFDDGKISPPPTAAREDNFDMVSEAIIVGSNDRYPYPATENWQKALGGHDIWMDAHVKVKIDPASKKREFEVKMNLHMEDMYNFNPGNADIKTGIKDEENGRFEVTGLAKEFLSKGDISRTITFTEPLAPVPDTRTPPSDQKVTTR